MKFFIGRIVAIAITVSLATLPGAAQTTPPQPAAQPDQPPKGKVIFSRSTGENGEITQSAPPASAPAGQNATAPIASDTERQAVTFTALDLDVHLHPATQHIAVRALLALRNDGSVPLQHLPLQISSALNWEQIRLSSEYVPYTVVTLNSDADHTGQLHEAAITLAQPLPPGKSLQLEVTYSGVIAASAQRLLAIGTPEDTALHSDWDRISTDFTGLRGFGNVVWYPVSSVPVILGDGARLFDEMGEHKQRLTGAHFRLNLTVEFPHGQAPTVALVNGQSLPLTVTEPNDLDVSKEVDGVATAGLGNSILGFEAPSLFVAIRTPHSAPNLTAFALPDNQVAVVTWTLAATVVTPFLEGWFGPRPHAQLSLLDLPDPQDAPFETGSMLAASLHEANAVQLDGILVHALTHAFLRNASPQPPAIHPSDRDLSPVPPAWLDEGLATFMGSLWVEKQHSRKQALETLEADRAALALAEPESPGQSPGQPLATAISPVYYRTKAAYVLWMLRDIVGDATLSAALHAFPTAQSPDKPASRSGFEKLLEASGNHRDLSWFFADWVDADKGLPDISIDSVFPNAVQSGNWLVAVNLTNNGYVQAEVPVTVRSAETSVTLGLHIPARGAAVQRILIQGKPTEVQVNDGAVPETQASVHIANLDQPQPTQANPSPQ